MTDETPRTEAERRFQGEMQLGDVIVRIFGVTDIEEVSVTHPGGPLGVCTAWFTPETHTIIKDVPLTIEPSLDCPECGWHHFITEGQVR